jgi:hypothetical protein
MAALLLLGAAACARRPGAAGGPDAAPAREVLRLERISVETGDWPAAAGAAPNERLVAHRLWEGLVQSPDFEAGREPGAPAEDAPAAHRRRARLKLGLGLELVPAHQLIRATATLALDLVDDDAAGIWDSLACDGELPRDAAQVPAVAARLVDCVVEHGARSLAEKAALRGADAPTVIAALDSPDAAVRHVAFAAVAERHLRAAVPRLLALLLHATEPEVRDGAIGALVALREPSAVRPLIELAQFKDLDMMRRIIDAVGTIGGDDAHAYLELVASGHDVPIIRELAAQALRHLDRRRPDGG